MTQENKNYLYRCKVTKLHKFFLSRGLMLANEEFISLTYEDIEALSYNPLVIKFMRKEFKRLSVQAAKKLIKLILTQEPKIKVSSLMKKYKGFMQYNMSKINENEEINFETIKDIRTKLNGFLGNVVKDIQLNTKLKTDDDDVYLIEKTTMYDKITKLICDENGQAEFKYDFDNPDMETTNIDKVTTLQRTEVQILTFGRIFDYALDNVYVCPRCGTIARKKQYETESTSGKIQCEGYYNYTNANGEPKTKVCNLGLKPSETNTSITRAYYYDIGYDDIDGSKQHAGAVSFNKYSPGFYDSVIYKIPNPNKTELFHIMDVRPLVPNKFPLPEKKEDENYVFTLQKQLDNFIDEKAGIMLFGLLPIKVALILQCIVGFLKLPLNFNIQIVGDSATGKSTILKYYGFFLYNQYNLSSNGLSLSVPALRGTRQAISILGKETKIVTIGYLGTYKAIHIDEAGENKELITNLKTFLLEENYGYDKAGATGIFNKRIAQFNLSENLDYTHLGQYRGSIKKAYKEFEGKIKDEEQVEWDESWDLHQPLFRYDNPYLRKIVKDKREEAQQKHTWWVDGYDFALHERFPFYFYLVNKKSSDEFTKISHDNINKDRVRENLELIKVLKNEEFPKFIKLLEEYKETDDIIDTKQIDSILTSYGFNADVRQKEFFYQLVKVSRIANMRKEYIEQDYELIKWFVENTNCKLDVADTNTYKINGPPDMEKENEINEKIEDAIEPADAQFGLPDGEF